MPQGGFRTAYTTQGVSTYYTNNSTTYRNPHFPGVVKCIHTILDRILLSGSGEKSGVGYNSSEVVVEKDTGERVEGVGIEKEGAGGEGEEEEGNVKKPALTVFDLAAGGGEATVAVRGWVRKVIPELIENVDGNRVKNEENGEERTRNVKSRKRNGGGGEGLKVYASDPFTYTLYEERVNGVQRQTGSGVGVGEVGEGRGEGEDRDGDKRDGEQGQDGNGSTITPTSTAMESLPQGEEGRGGGDKRTSDTDVDKADSKDLSISTSTSIPQTTIFTTNTSSPNPSPYPYIPCHPFSFRDIPVQGLDTLLLPPLSPSSSDPPPSLSIDITLISFALHLCPPTELFSLLYELSRHSAYLVVIAPHKNPHIPGGGESGWVGPVIEVLVKKERVRGRVFRSVNF